MAFDSVTRGKLQRLVTACRNLLTDEFDDQLQGIYGIYAGEGRVLDLDKLTSLDDDQRVTGALLRERIAHLQSGLAASKTPLKDAVQRVLREQAFTVLNRFAALRMAEERELVLQCVGEGLNSKGFQVFESLAGPDLGSQYDRYCVFLGCLFDELSLDLGVLFDRSSPFGLLFPREPKLKEFFQLLNDPELKSLWREDETIGWIYQYFNDESERKKMREESSAPRNSRELAVRNQFFTPRYVVEFLTDNTLGRLWYEMTRGETALREQCRYLVRRPNEIFLKPGESAPEQAKQDNLSQEELLQQCVYIPHRLLKDPRDIRLLDPACGSMHFGLYAFDLFTVIYGEAWEIAHGSDDAAKSAETFAPFVTFAGSFADKTTFLREVPRLIVEHNLHGIEIDPRCIQIAGLSLWLRAQRAWHQAGVKAGDRPRITRSNLVCAEPMPGEQKHLKEFCQSLKQPVIGQMVEVIFDKMRLAGEAGSLLKIEEEIRDLIHKTKLRWTETYRFDQESDELFSRAEIAAASRKRERTEPELNIDFSGITDESFWEKAEQRIYDALEAYAVQAENGGGFQRRLFADDAAQGFAFIDLCRKSYDVAVMNPPFGEAPATCKGLLAASYSDQAEDLYCWFVQRGRELSQGGFVGVISSDSFLRYTDYAKYRGYLIEDSLLPILFDLGWGVLDGAYVSAATYVLSSGYQCKAACFIDLTAIQDKGFEVAANVDALNSGTKNESLHVHSLETFRAMDGTPFCFSFSIEFFDWVKASPKVRENVAEHGIGAGPHNIFFRLAWEIPYSSRLDPKRWPGLVNGGLFSPYYRDDYLCIDWRGDGELIKAHLNKIYPYLKGNVGMKIQREHVYYRAGLTYGKRSDRFNAQVLSSGFIPSFNGIGLYPNQIEDAWWLLAYFNCRFVAYFLNLTCGLHKNSVYIDRVPVPLFSDSEKRSLSGAAKELYAKLRESVPTEEVSNLFVIPPALSTRRPTIREAVVEWRKGDRARESRLWELQDKIEKTVAARIPAFEELEPAISEDQGPNLLVTESGNEEHLVETEVPEHSDQVARPILNRDNGNDSTDLFRFALKNALSVAEARAKLDGSNFVGESELQHETASIFSWAFGCVLGRWDIRYATGEGSAPELPDLFAPLPVCPPGMLQGDDGLPLSPEAGRRLRAEGRYPLDVAWDGILVDDPENSLDLERHVHAALVVVWGDRADELEHEACSLLSVPTLREWFRRPAGFFADHLKRYSKSRRQAPIYWPLSTATGGYTLWLYYHRLNAQTLYTCVTDFVKPKLDAVTADAERLQSKTQTGGTAKERAELQELRDFRAELQELHDELLRVAQLPWKPNLNDGVLITASPLWKLFRLPKWQKDLKACWEKLATGDYDWAHLAYTIWPDRVRDACKKDRSLAIAHGLEDLCEIEPPRAKRANKPQKPSSTLV
jgi:hypothetical protein